MEQCAFYCLSFNDATMNDPERKAIMEARFKNADIQCTIYKGVPLSDPRIAGRDITLDLKRLLSITHGHLDMIKMFYESGKQFGFFCEDDVKLHRDLKSFIPQITKDFSKMNLDILLLGYLSHEKIFDWMPNFNLVRPQTSQFKYHHYPSDQWGVQMYMISRPYAKQLLDMYSTDYADRSMADKNLAPFSPDWILSKSTLRRALITPVLVVEEYLTDDPFDPQKHYHYVCYKTLYDPKVHV